MKVIKTLTHAVNKVTQYLKERNDQDKEREIGIILKRGQLYDIMFIMTRYLDMVDVQPQRYYSLLTYLRECYEENKK